LNKITIKQFQIRSREEARLRRLLAEKQNQDEAENLIEELQNLCYDERGFELDDRGHITCYYQEFADYLNRALRVLLIDSKRYIYNRKKGVYQQIDDSQLRAYCMKIFEEYPMETYWSISEETQYYKRFLIGNEVWDEWKECEKGICLENGIYEYETRELRKHSSKYLFRDCLPVRYNEEAEAPQFLEALDDMFEGDQEVIAIIQEIFGYILYRGAGYPLQKFFIFRGEGSNGKSVLIHLLQKMLGNDLVSATPFQKLGQKFGMSNAAESWVNFSNECDTRKAIDLEVVKTITGGGMMEVERKYQQAKTEQTKTKFVVCTNATPVFYDKTYGLHRRLCIIDFPITYRDIGEDEELPDGVHQADPELPQKLESEMEGILIWSLEGLGRLMDNGWEMSQCEAVEIARQKFLLELDPVSHFVNERCEEYPEKPTGTEWTRTSAYYDAFEKWLRDREIRKPYKMDRVKFHKRLREVVDDLGWKVDNPQIDGRQRYEGMRLLEEE
jgi:P4 family phage/plasmid primase-like protien